jgi:tRNA U34 5-methylaminomethyl-2-thiouridine-forming methyltransferase MnmC
LKTLVKTSDGSHTLYVPELNEHYHSVHGAVRESEYIFIGEGYCKCGQDPLNIFEVGFGTGLNVLLTAVKSQEDDREIYYTSVEKYPLEETMISALNHSGFAGRSGRELFDLIHGASWNKWQRVMKNFNLLKVKADLKEYIPDGRFHLVYFDAFGPEKQPDMWTEKVFSSIFAATEPGGILVTYSAKGEVKRNLRACGFKVSVLPGPPGKRHITRAVKY